MQRMPLTEEALATYAANHQIGAGEHEHTKVRIGAYSGRYLGDVPFDAAVHRPEDINPLSVMGIALDADYVRKVMPSRPLHANVVVDLTPRDELSAVTVAKTHLAYELLQSLENALPGPKDRLHLWRIGGETVKSTLSTEAEPLTLEASPAAIQEEVADLAQTGLTFVLSDFERFSPTTKMMRTLGSLVAVKINHQLEREVPAGVGYAVLDGWYDVNTDRPRQLRKVNADLEARHLAIISSLEKAGAAVASLVINERFVDKYDALAADQAIAVAIASRKA